MFHYMFDYSGLESRHMYMCVVIDYCWYLIMIISIKTKKIILKYSNDSVNQNRNVAMSSSEWINVD